jgi:putative peptidoglycan lipid II flippase
MKHKKEGKGFSLIILTLGSFVSMFIGLASNIIIASYFGTGAEMDAYVVALVIPTTLTTVLITSLGLFFVPAFISIEENTGESAAWTFATTVITIAAPVLATVSMLVYIYANPIADLVAGGFDPAKREITASLIKIMSPVLFFSALGTLFAAFLQSIGKFQVIVIGSLAGSGMYLFLLYILSPMLGIRGVAIAITANYAFTLLFQMLLGLRQRATLIRFDFSEALPHLVSLAKDSFSLSLATIFRRFEEPIEKYYATQAGAGSASYMAYGGRIVTIIQNTYVQNIAKVFFPSISRHFAKGDNRTALDELFLGVRLNGFLIIPILAGIELLSEPLIRLLFERGAFTSVDTKNVALVLFYGSLSLIQPMFASLTSKALIYLKAIKFMFFSSILKLTLFITLILVLMPRYGFIGIVLAGSLSITWPLHLLYIRHRVGPLGASKLLSAFVRFILLSIFMWFACSEWISILEFDSQAHQDLVMLISTPIIGLIIYFSMARFLNFPEFQLMTKHILKLKTQSRSS